ncbi:hypothetical protein [Nocardioides sp. W7]|uniref:hypothetical protein n=1 Tax=Nocardioides sp. W7 TaxID=2931390 RepID=UPI001FD1AB12|nr:hypothetical protein [Nocardioides sp. W7]
MTLKHASTLLAAAALTGGLLTAAPSAVASTGAGESVQAAVATPAVAARAQQPRKIKINGKQKGQRFYLVGRIKPAKRFSLVVQRKVCTSNTDCKKKYTKWKGFKTTRKGTFRVSIAGPTGRAKRVYYRVYAPAGKRYAPAMSDKSIYVYKF